MTIATVDNRVAMDYGLAKDTLRYCTRVTVCETKTEQVYRWVDADHDVEYAYGIYNETSGLVEFHEVRNYKANLFDGWQADELKKVGHYERPIIITPLPADGKVTVLWNGGWDDYKIDPGQIRDMTADELGKDFNFPTVKDGWLKCSFIKKHGLGNDNQAVRILAHLGGGD